jgi:hypothetical protein
MSRIGGDEEEMLKIREERGGVRWFGFGRCMVMY